MIHSCSTLAIIPARGGSKGVLQKNLRLLCGKPLVAWSIEAALKASLVDRVCVSTDNNEILTVADRSGADTVRRPRTISGDESSSESALIHALDHYSANGESFDELVFLQCTSPLTSAEDIDETIRTRRESGLATAVAVVDFHYFLWRRDGSGGGVGVNHDSAVRLRRQDREPEYLEAGAVYVMEVSGFRKHGHRFFGGTAMHVIPASHCLEIDEPQDLVVAEAMMRSRLAENLRSALPRPTQGLLLDFDGVLTDNHVWVDQHGTESVACNRSDGWGLARLRSAGVPVAVISTECNPVVTTRCKKLGVDCLQGISDKVAAARSWADENGLDGLSSAVFVGNDENDAELMAAVGAAGGCVLVPSDAHPSVRLLATAVLDKEGGHGAVREVCDVILEALGGQRP